MNFSDLPTFDELKEKRHFWPAVRGSKDEGLGMLRYLTPEHVAKVAKAELRTGERVCLNWDMTKLESPGFNRFPCKHDIIPVPNHEGIAWDDIWQFNPQAGSQWDGFRHFSTTAPDGARVWYGGTTSDEIVGYQSDRIGIGHWAQDGIAARGILVDYVAYAEQQHGPNARAADGMSGHAITLAEVQAILRQCRIDPQPGDILFVRCGFTRTWDGLTAAQKQQYRANTLAHKHAHSGLEQSEAVARFLWDHHIVAVAGDGVSFEVRPTRDPDWDMHRLLLAGWGVPIGEMFDLERLAALCQKLQRWTFFVTSSPLNHPKGVASPPGCMALF
ncbi:hypothetical protein SPI_01167 [Niveomyces insectorum RCEF 264]|uniref:Cyclase n=1 Tax=Niveomyces insectorum RCEF 264 TaxID=1081102 RepID=A0A167YQZ0_9HYPO|nr:hypothetical protein SPI_01167 [Niveomyces insectorum RCEF 264]